MTTEVVFSLGCSYNFDMEQDSKVEQLFQKLYTQKPTELTNKVHSVTIMKYLGSDKKYHFEVIDRFDIPDEVDRLDYMNFLKIKMLKSGKMKKHLWTKTTPLF